MKESKIFVLLLVMIATGTIGFMGCSRTKDYWIAQTNSSTSVFKPLFDRFTQDPKLFVYEFVDISVIGFLVGYTQDNQLTKGTRVAALYAYSDVIYVLRPKNKFDCTLFTPPDGSAAYLICFLPVGTHCRHAGVRCGGGSTLHYLICS